MRHQRASTPRFILRRSVVWRRLIWEVCYEAGGCSRPLCLTQASWWRKGAIASSDASFLLQALRSQAVALDHCAGCEVLPGRTTHGSCDLAAEVWNAAGLLRTLASARRVAQLTDAVGCTEVYLCVRSLYLLTAGAE